jgi:hypothetical protein
MKDKAIIRMGATDWSVTVRGADGAPIKFDFRKMQEKDRKNFVVTFVRMFREAGLPIAA